MHQFPWLIALLFLVGCQSPSAEPAASPDPRFQKMTFEHRGNTQQALIFDPAMTAPAEAAWLILPDRAMEASTILSDAAFQRRAEEAGRLLVVLANQQEDSAPDEALVEIVIAALVQTGKVRLDHVYLVGFGEGGATAIALADSTYFTPAGIVAVSTRGVSSIPGELPGITTVFLVGALQPESLRTGNEKYARDVAAAMKCGTSVGGKANGIRQRGFYGCRDGATVLNGAIDGFSSLGTGAGLDLPFLIDSYFAAYGN